VPLTLREILIPGTDADIVARYETLAERAKEVSFGILEDEYVVLDTETTGFSAERDSLIEIAAAIMRGPEITARFSTFVDPGRDIPPAITELTGITDDDVRGAPDAWEAIRELDAFAGSRMLVAHNAPFDCAFIAANGGGRDRGTGTGWDRWDSSPVPPVPSPTSRLATRAAGWTRLSSRASPCRACASTSSRA
jgi:ATP-dependent DNA helicase DinG